MKKETKMIAARNLERTVNQLLEAKASGKHVYCDFNGHILHSDTVTMDGAYMEILGCTKAEHDKRKQELRESYERAERLAELEAIKKIPDWIARGQTLIYPERYDEWEDCVHSRATDTYHGNDLDAALEIMEALDNGVPMQDIKKILKLQTHSGLAEYIVKNIVFLFSKQGPAFLEATTYGKLSPEDKQIIDEEKEENKKLEKAHTKTYKNKKPKNRIN